MPERAAYLVDFISGNTVFLEAVFPLAHDAPYPIDGRQRFVAGESEARGPAHGVGKRGQSPLGAERGSL